MGLLFRRISGTYPSRPSNENRRTRLSRKRDLLTRDFGDPKTFQSSLDSIPIQLNSIINKDRQDRNTYNRVGFDKIQIYLFRNRLQSPHSLLNMLPNRSRSNPVNFYKFQTPQISSPFLSRLMSRDKSHETSTRRNLELSRGVESNWCQQVSILDASCCQIVPISISHFILKFERLEYGLNT